MDSRIKTPKIDVVLLHQRHKSREYITGTLCLTDRHLIFIEPTGLKETWVLYHHVRTVERLPLTTRGYPLLIETKTFQQLSLIIPRESDCVNVMETINLFSQPERHEDLYAFQYKPQQVAVSKGLGWGLYDARVEFERMGVANSNWTMTDLNKNYELCETYCSVLYVPAAVGNSVIMGSAKFRSKGRLPALSFYYAPKQSALCRCSQPLAYLTRRSTEDEQMIQAIITANPNASFLYLVDTRPRINAMANKAAHKGGYESAENYPNTRYQFYNIGNIHVMRESLQKLMEGIYSGSSVGKLLSALENSSWLKHIHLILETSVFIAKALYHEGVNVLVHCSDGWDRTAQTCALASLMIDPFYRTLHGFMVLIEKEWLSFGHKFTLRNSHLAGDSRESSPIFTQFLECVWQLMVQFPTAFQFNEFFLITIHDHLYSCQFGTFLGNCERERIKNRFSEQTYSLWGFIWGHLDDYLNPLHQNNNKGIIVPCTNVPQLSLWRGLYCCHERASQPKELWEEMACSLHQQNSCLEDHIKYLKERKRELAERLQTVHSEANSFGVAERSNTTSNIANHVPTCATDRNNCSQQLLVASLSTDVESNPAVDKSDTLLCNSSSSDTCASSLSTLVPRPTNKEMDTTSCADDVAAAVRDSGTPLPPEANTTRNSKENTTASSSLKPDTHPVNKDRRRQPVPIKDLLLHAPEMNLPWTPLRGAAQCSCGVPFTFTKRKFHCSYCGSVVCGMCGRFQASLPHLASTTPYRVCKTCSRLMDRRQKDIEEQKLMEMKR